LAAVIAVSHARAIYNFSLDVRKRNYARVSTQNCDECSTLEAFYEKNEFAYVLFYERALMGGNKYKEAIVQGWMETCAALRWSRIACGMVDMLDDRAYAEKYIEPKTAPAHIIVHKGQVVPLSNEQVKELMSKPGDKDHMLAHLKDVFKEHVTWGTLTLSTKVSHKDSLDSLVKQHRLVIAGFIGEEPRLADVFQAAVQEQMLGNGRGDRVAGDPNSGRKGKGGNPKVGKDKWRIAFVAVQGKGIGAHFGSPSAPATDRSIAAFVDGKLLPGAKFMKADAKPGDPDVIKAIEKIVRNGIDKCGGMDEKSGPMANMVRGDEL